MFYRFINTQKITPISYPTWLFSPVIISVLILFISEAALARGGFQIQNPISKPIVMANASSQEQNHRINMALHVLDLPGDVNLDSVVSMLDVNLCIAHISDMVILTGQALQNADIISDSHIDIRDAVAILNHIAFANTYYVSFSLGDDLQNGLSPETAWKTLERVRQQELNPGDQILFRKGDTWRNILYVQDKGSSDHWITYSSYGEGSKPRILGSEKAQNWTQVATHIWQSDTTLENPYLGGYSLAEVFFEEHDGSVSWGRQREYTASYSNMVQEYDWSWSSNTLYIYAISSPETAYQAVEVPQRSSCIRFPNIDGVVVLDSDYAEYIALDNLELMYARRHGVYPGYNEIEAHGLRITYCHIGCIGIKGGASAYGIAAWQSDVLIQNNTIHDCGRRGISYNTYTSHTADLTISNVTIDHNHFYHGFHTTGPDISSLPGLGHTYSNFTISNNLIDDRGILVLEETSNSIYVNGTSGNTYSNFYIINNVILGSTARALLMKKVDTVAIYHNTIYGAHSDSDPYSLVSVDDITDIDMRNNLIYGTFTNPPHLARCVLDEGATSFQIRNWNLYFQDNPDQPFTGSQHGFGGWDTFMNEWEYWTQGSGFDLDSPEPQNPLFVDEASGNFQLQETSPARHTGTPIPGLLLDRNGIPYDTEHPSLGAYQYQTK